MAWKRRWVTVHFIVDDKFVFRCRTCATVNVNSYDDLIENYMEDSECLEDVEFLGVIRDSYEENEVPNIDDLDESHIMDGYTDVFL